MATPTPSSAGARRSPEMRPRPPRIDPDRDALFLDIDGTLAPFEAHPGGVGPLLRRTRIVRNIVAALGGRVALVTGRTVQDADRIVDGACPVVAGVHGLSIRGPDGIASDLKVARSLPGCVEAVKEFAAGRPGVLIEDKGLAVAIHFRQAPGAAEAVQAFGERLAAQHDLHGQPGDMVFELRERGGGKGAAVKHLMDLAPFRGARPIFVGDDLTDEDGFGAVEALGGYGVLVGDREGSRADHRLADVRAVLDWLEEAT